MVSAHRIVLYASAAIMHEGCHLSTWCPGMKLSRFHDRASLLWIPDHSWGFFSVKLIVADF